MRLLRFARNDGFIFFFCIFCSLFFAATLSAATPAEQKQLTAQVRVDQRRGERLPLELTFTDESGRLVRLGDYFKKKPVILTPVYYECPMLCTVTLSELVAALKVIGLTPGKDFEIVTYSINPRETPKLALAKKENYLRLYSRPEAREAWHFLTGDDAAIKEMSEALGFYYAYDEKSGEYAHASSVIIAAPDGVLTHYFTGVGIASKDLRLALVDASKGKIGNMADLILLMCYHYDPASGKYGFAILSALRLTGLLTVLALAVAVIIMIKTEKSKCHSREGGNPQ